MILQPGIFLNLKNLLPLACNIVEHAVCHGGCLVENDCFMQAATVQLEGFQAYISTPLVSFFPFDVASSVYLINNETFFRLISTPILKKKLGIAVLPKLVINRCMAPNYSSGVK